MSVRIVSLNIQHGGGKRIDRLSDWLATKSPSVVVLPEWRNNVGGQRIRKRLADSGFQTVATARATSKINSVLLAATPSRRRLRHRGRDGADQAIDRQSRAA